MLALTVLHASYEFFSGVLTAGVFFLDWANMLRQWIIAVAIGLLIAGAEAQATFLRPLGLSPGQTSLPAGSAADDPSGGLTPDTTFEVKLLTPINSAKAKVGKKITAQMTQKVVSGDVTIVPLNSKLTGHVTEVQKRDNAHPEARLGMVFEQIQLKHGRTLAFVGVLHIVSGEYGEPLPACIWSHPDCHIPPPEERDWPDVEALHQDRYTIDTGRGITILSRKQNIELGYHVRLTLKVVPAQP